jgi:hypothetical protein
MDASTIAALMYEMIRKKDDQMTMANEGKSSTFSLQSLNSRAFFLQMIDLLSSGSCEGKI